MSETNEIAEQGAEVSAVVNFDAGEKLGMDKIVLRRPFQYQGVIYREITFREPNGADVEKFLNAKGGVDTLAMFTALTGVPVLALREMYAADYAALIAPWESICRVRTGRVRNPAPGRGALLSFLLCRALLLFRAAARWPMDAGAPATWSDLTGICRNVGNERFDDPAPGRPDQRPGAKG